MIENILITSAGKRVSLVRIFREALKKLSLQAKVYTTDMKPEMAPAGFVSDGCFKVPRVTDDNYIDKLIDICHANNISLIIPTIDTELALLAENKSLLRNKGIETIVSSADFVYACRDKRKTSELFQQLDICIPKIRDKYHPEFPMFAKPYDGSLSKDIYVIRSSEELTPEIMQHPKLIFMEYIDKTQYKEFTVDMYYGKDNKVKAIIPRERVEIRAGEINKGYTRKNYLVPFLKERMDYMPGVVGCICIQLFYNEMTHKVFGIEVNPRFGGGYPLSYYAGSNFPEYLLREYFLNESISYTDDWKDNTLMLRYDSEVIVYEEEGVRF